MIDRRGEKEEKEGRGESKKKQIISDNFISKRQTNMTEKKNTRTNILGSESPSHLVFNVKKKNCGVSVTSLEIYLIH